MESQTFEPTAIFRASYENSSVFQVLKLMPKVCCTFKIAKIRYDRTKLRVWRTELLFGIPMMELGDKRRREILKEDGEEEEEKETSMYLQQTHVDA